MPPTSSPYLPYGAQVARPAPQRQHYPCDSGALDFQDNSTANRPPPLSTNYQPRHRGNSSVSQSGGLWSPNSGPEPFPQTGPRPTPSPRPGSGGRGDDGPSTYLAATARSTAGQSTNFYGTSPLNSMNDVSGGVRSSQLSIKQGMTPRGLSPAVDDRVNAMGAEQREYKQDPYGPNTMTSYSTRSGYGMPVDARRHYSEGSVTTSPYSNNSRVWERETDL